VEAPVDRPPEASQAFENTQSAPGNGAPPVTDAADRTVAHALPAGSDAAEAPCASEPPFEDGLRRDARRAVRIERLQSARQVFEDARSALEKDTLAGLWREPSETLARSPRTAPSDAILPSHPEPVDG
jgi:hypothetical protein